MINKKLVAFDLDDTLSKSKVDIQVEMVRLLCELLEHKYVAVISGAIVEGLVAQDIIGPEYSFWPFFFAFYMQMVLLPLAIADQIRTNELD